MTNEPTEATTWEECAQHIERGGVVEYKRPAYGWVEDNLDPDGMRHYADPPGCGGWYRRRLVPIPAPEVPVGMSVGPLVDGVQTYYGTAFHANAAGMEFRTIATDNAWPSPGKWPTSSIVQARWPQKPTTERVHWWASIERKDQHDGRIVMVECREGSLPRVYFDSDAWMDVTDPYGMVDVLVEP